MPSPKAYDEHQGTVSMGWHRRTRELILQLLMTCCILVSTSALHGQVRLERQGPTFRLTRNGLPYTIKGVGGDTRLDQLVAAGGNSIRTWTSKDIGKILDQAQQHGLTVCAGLWLGHQRHDFDYQDQSAVLAQLDEALAIVRQHKDHPALLMWGVGNEMEGQGKDPSVWYAVNHIAREIKQIDGNHPVMTVIAELGEDASKIRSIERFCPDVDIIGVNSYGGIRSLPQRFKTAKSSKPYVISEHGPPGPWEAPTTKWGVPIEVTSTEKGTFYSEGYHANVIHGSNLCLGAYSFLWGHKQETTATWFGMLLPGGIRLEAADAMKEAWSGIPPINRCPKIKTLTLDRRDDLRPGDRVQANLEVTDAETDPLIYHWVLRTDSGTIGEGGDPQEEEETIENAIQADGAKAVVTLPKKGGQFRLFAYVKDDQGGAAVANLPIKTSEAPCH